MTETTKKIIELIEPYMDKTLSKWCLVNLYINLPDEWWYWINLKSYYSICEYLWYKISFTYLNSNKYRGDVWFFGSDFEKQVFLDLENYTIQDSKSLQYHSDDWKYWYDIIWHYDITAVLRYIKSKWIFTMPQWIDTIFFYKINNDTEYSIPNKPLHLYSKQEDKELLDSLISLKNE